MAGSKKLLIFDCDGVLVDSEVISIRVEVEELNRLGCEVSAQDYLDASLGRHEEDRIFKALADAHGVTLPADFLARTRAKLDECFARELRPIEGVEESLRLLPFPKCVASSSRLERLKQVLSMTGLDRYFNGNIFSASQVARGKPHPDLFLKAAQDMNTDPKDCLVIEDSPVGIQASLAAGMQAIGFTGGGHCNAALAEKLRRAGCRNLFSDMRDLPKFCHGLHGGPSKIGINP